MGRGKAKSGDTARGWVMMDEVARMKSELGELECGG